MIALDHPSPGVSTAVRLQATVNGNSLAWIWTLPINPQPGETDVTTLTRQ